jgi:alkylation response protein AidB-like acyl-CoA dehydrogenase
MILFDELNRLGTGGLNWGLLIGTSIGLPPVLRFGDKQLKERVVYDVLQGEKLFCLCVTEPWGGSDVAGL